MTRSLVAFILAGLLLTLPAEIVNQVYIHRNPAASVGATLFYIVFLGALPEPGRSERTRFVHPSVPGASPGRLIDAVTGLRCANGGAAASPPSAALELGEQVVQLLGRRARVNGRGA
jgi:hypothetical protein